MGITASVPCLAAISSLHTWKIMEASALVPGEAEFCCALRVFRHVSFFPEGNLTEEPLP